MKRHTVSLRTNLIVFALLVALLFATIGAAKLDLGSLNTVVALAIAIAKAIVIMLYFMHLRYSSRLVQIFAGAGFLWLSILIAVIMSDYLTRGVLDIAGK